MPKLLTIACGLLLLAAVPAHAESSVDTQLFGKDPGKDHVFACFTRHYDAAHLKAHPKQNVTDMTLLVNSNFGDETDDARSYSLTMGINFRSVKTQFQAYGGCSGTDEAQKSLNCYIDCDGGSITVRSKDANAILVDVPYGAGIYDPDAPDNAEPDAGIPPKAAFGADDKLFLLTRISSKLCVDLVSDDDKQLLLDSAQ